MRRALSALLLAAALAGVAAAAPAVPVRRDRPLERAILAELNSARVEFGLPRLAASAALARAARAHTRAMVATGTFGHGRSLRARLAAAGARPRSAGETIAWGSPALTARETVALWLRSRPHRAILLRRGWRSVGIGAVRAAAAPGAFRGRRATVVTADFAGP